MAEEKSKARGHHYISQCYLKGFTELGTKASTFTVLDLEKKEILTRQKSMNFCKERDFNRGEYKTLDPNSLECFLGEEFEPKVDKALRNIERTGGFEGEDRIIIFTLIALFYVRNPYRRKAYDEFLTYISKVKLSYAANNVGKVVNGVLITEDFKETIQNNKVEIEVKESRNQHITTELKISAELIDLLAHRKWTLIQAPDNEIFVTSNSPVALIWVEGGKRLSPGFALKNTEVHFALSKKFALVGSFEGVDEVVIASKEIMALINSNLIAKANRWLFAAKDFYFFTPSDNFSYGISEFVESLKN